MVDQTFTEDQARGYVLTQMDGRHGTITVESRHAKAVSAYGKITVKYFAPLAPGGTAPFLITCGTFEVDMGFALKNQDGECVDAQFFEDGGYYREISFKDGDTKITVEVRHPQAGEAVI